MKAPFIQPQDISKPSKRLAQVRAEDLSPLPPPYEDFNTRPLTELKEDKIANVESSLDGTIAIGIPKAKTQEEEEKYLKAFLSGLRKLFEKENNWTFLQPLLLSMEHCAKCQTCSDACPAFEMSENWDGRSPVPIFARRCFAASIVSTSSPSERYRPGSRAISN